MAGHGARGAAPTIDSIFRANATHRPDMDALIDRIGAIDGIERTMSSIIMATKFER